MECFFDWYFESSRCHQESKLASLQNKILSLAEIKEEGKRKWLPKLPALPLGPVRTPIFILSLTLPTPPPGSQLPHTGLSFQLSFLVEILPTSFPTELIRTYLLKCGFLRTLKLSPYFLTRPD